MGVDRRTFIKYASLAAAGNAAALRPFGALNALAQTTTVAILAAQDNDLPLDAAYFADAHREKWQVVIRRAISAVG